MIHQSNSFNLMAYCNLYLQNRDHDGIDKWSTNFQVKIKVKLEIDLRTDDFLCTVLLSSTRK